MPEMHLTQPGFTYSSCGPFTKFKRRIKRFKETGDSRYIYQNELDKTCFQHDMVYGDFKDLNRRKFAVKVLPDKAFNIAKDPKYDCYQRGLASMVYECFDKTSSGSGIKNINIPNKELAVELHKLSIRKFNKRKVHSHFIDNILGPDLGDMQLIIKFKKGFRFWLCVIDIYSKYAWVILLKDKNGIKITNALQKVLDESNHKPNKIWADKGSEFYNRSMKSWLGKNCIKMYSTNNEEKSVFLKNLLGP